jgi:hypothetical protein
VIFCALVHRVELASVTFQSFASGLKRRPKAHASPRICWRLGVAWCALVALSWPSLGLLPWVLDPGTDLLAAHAVIETSSAAHDDASAHDHAADASDIPGSPTHPADHDCFQCQVLKHLSRCTVAPLDPPAVNLPAGNSVQPPVIAETQFVGHVAALPPVRAPPLRRA